VIDCNESEQNVANPNKGLGFDRIMTGHKAQNFGRLGEWIAGLWLMKLGNTVAFGAANSKHDLISENNATHKIQSVQVKITQPIERGWKERILKNQSPRYQWRLKSSRGYKMTGRGNQDASLSDRLILVGCNVKRGKKWVLDSEIHDLRDWKNQMAIRFLKTDVEAADAFINMNLMEFDSASTAQNGEDLDSLFLRSHDAA
jgi:hypothetical protein